MKPSPFDFYDYQSFKISINDNSVFPDTPGFRRATLYPKLSDTTYITSGVVNYHFSIMKTPDLKLNTTHQYELVNLGGSYGQPSIFQIRYGTDYQPNQAPGYVSDDANKLRIYFTSADDYDSVISVYAVEFKPDVFHNFAVTVDWDAETVAVGYSEGSNPLADCVAPSKYYVKAPADFSIGLTKYPTGLCENPAKGGYQEQYIDEAIIFGGVFFKDSGYLS